MRPKKKKMWKRREVVVGIEEGGPSKVGLVEEGRRSGGAAGAWPSDLSSLHGGTDLLLTVVFSLPFLRNFIFSEELNLQRAHPSGVDTQAPILFSSLAFNYKKSKKQQRHHHQQRKRKERWREGDHFFFHNRAEITPKILYTTLHSL